MIDDDSVMRPEEAAAMLLVDIRTLARWTNEGKLTLIKTLGGHHRYREKEIRDLASSNALVIDRRRRNMIKRVNLRFTGKGC